MENLRLSFDDENLQIRGGVGDVVIAIAVLEIVRPHFCRIVLDFSNGNEFVDWFRVMIEGYMRDALGWHVVSQTSQVDSVFEPRLHKYQGLFENKTSQLPQYIAKKVRSPIGRLARRSLVINLVGGTAGSRNYKNLMRSVLIDWLLVSELNTQCILISNVPIPASFKAKFARKNIAIYDFSDNREMWMNAVLEAKVLVTPEGIPLYLRALSKKTTIYFYNDPTVYQGVQGSGLNNDEICCGIRANQGPVLEKIWVLFSNRFFNAGRMLLSISDFRAALNAVGIYAE